MIPVSALFDQSTLSLLIEHDPVVQRYRAFFALFDWSQLPEREETRLWPGPRPHPRSAYIKALLVKLCEGKAYVSQLRRFLCEHPLLILELGFLPLLDPTQPYGFDIQRTVPGERWLRHLQQSLDQRWLQALLHATVTALQAEIPGLGEVVAFDVKHIYAWVRENNPRESITDRYCKERQPTGDLDCRVGVKKSTNQEQADGSRKERKEYLWGYGSGVAAAITPDYGDVILAEYTQPFNQNDITYYRPLYLRATVASNLIPTHITADAAYDAWYVYETCVHHGGIAAVPLNQHGHPDSRRDVDGVPLCSQGLRMHATYQFAHTNGYLTQRFRCPLLSPTPTGQTCDHEQFVKGKGCVKDLNWEAGGQMRVTLDRDGPLYHAIYTQRTSCERINSQAQALGIERPKVRQSRSVRNLNTLTYLIINAKALARCRSINASLLSPIRLRE
jgi:Transposase DDE domain